MSLRYLVAAFAARVGHPGLKLVLLKLSDNANDDGICWPSRRRIAYETELSESSVKRHLAELETKGWIKVHRRQKDGVNLPSRYELVGLTNLIEGWGQPDPTGVKKNTWVGSHRPHPVHTDPGGGVCVTPEPPIEPSTPPPSLDNSVSQGGGGVSEADEIVSAGVWAAGLVTEIRNKAGLARAIRVRLAREGANKEDLQALTAYRKAHEAHVTPNRQAEIPPSLPEIAAAGLIRAKAALRGGVAPHDGVEK